MLEFKIVPYIVFINSCSLNSEKSTTVKISGKESKK